MDDNTPRVLYLSETFSSIQGEGSYSGYPCFFIRLAGCNLRCRYCDTSYAWQSGEKAAVDDILLAWKKSRIPLVLVTGGEPLLQPAVYELMERLVRAGATCLLETNGSISVARVPFSVVKVLDWKTPGSGHADSFQRENLRFISKKDQIKFVIGSKSDYEWGLNRVREHYLHHMCQVLFSPVFHKLEPQELASWMMTDLPQARMQLQLHKVLWGDIKGV